MTTYKACVIGYPIHHSLSPKLHKHWLHRYGIKGTYEAIEVHPDNLSQEIESLKNKGFRGCNITLPHKEHMFTLCDVTTDIAQEIKAVNTVVFQKDGTIWGTNTDVYGFSQNLIQNNKVDSTMGNALVFGAGGASRAIIVALQHMGFTHIHIANRTIKRAEDLATEFITNTCVITYGDLSSAEQHLLNCTLLVNTTSLGMAEYPPLTLSMANLQKTAVVTDIVYTPLVTPLLKMAQERGNPIVDGLGMLLYQAIPGFEHWFNHSSPQVDEDLRQHILQFL